MWLPNSKDRLTLNALLGIKASSRFDPKSLGLFHEKGLNSGSRASKTKSRVV